MPAPTTKIFFMFCPPFALVKRLPAPVRSLTPWIRMFVEDRKKIPTILDLR
jgi:hypothetical protein